MSTTTNTNTYAPFEDDLGASADIGIGAGTGDGTETDGRDSHLNCEILLVRACVSAGDRAALVRRRHRGEVVSIARGSYADAAVWGALDRHAQYRLRVRAAAELLDSDTVFSHESAAALWRLPWLGQWPSRVHTAGATAAGGRSNTSVFHHTAGVAQAPEAIDGLRVTPLARTVIDIARTVNFGTAVVVADAALRRTAHPIGGIPNTLLTRATLMEELARVPLRHGSAKARAVINFADGRADRPGESISRVSMLQARLPAPLIQVRLRGQSGRTWIVDFWWPECNLIGEFDGRWKYSDPNFLLGRTPHEVLLDEKFREDDLRAAGHNFSRWDWGIAMSPSRLKSHLLAAGLR